MTIPGIIKKNNPTDIIKVINKFRARVLRNILNCENKSVSSPVKILATNMVQTANVHRLVNCLLAWLFKDCVSKIVTSYIILINNKIHYIAYFIIG